jgi:N-carbamoylputrescine amidase
MSRTVRIGLAQMTCSADVEANRRKAEVAVRDCASRGANIVCLQELYASLYFCQQEEYEHFKLAEPIPGPSTERFGALAKELGIVIVVPLFERRDAGIYHNSAVILERDGTIKHHYRKMHIPDDPGFMEKFYFTPGDLGFTVADTSVGRVAVLICWDQWFPEAARLVGMAGAEMLFYPTAIGWNPQQPELNAFREAWQISMRGHAIANGLFVAAPNRTGSEGELTFWGQSFVADPLGRLLAVAAADADENLVVECNLDDCEKMRQEMPFFRDRRIDGYSDLTLRYRGR